MSKYVSIINPGELILDDSSPVTAVVNGVEMGRGYMARDEVLDPPFSFCQRLGLPLIDPSEYRDRIEEMERTKTRLSDLIKAAGMRSKNQKSTNYCWVFAATSAVQVVRIIQGEQHVELSPASVGCPITNYRNVGGWSTRAIEYGGPKGWVPSSMWPDTAIDATYDNAQTKAERANYLCPEWWELSSRSDQELMTCLLSRIPVAIGQNHWSHAVLACDPLIDASGNTSHRDLNSWSESYGDKGWFIQAGNKKYADDAVAPRVAP